MEQVSKQLSPLSLALIFIGLLLLMSLVSNLHYASMLTDEAIEKERRPQRVAELYGRGYRPDMPRELVWLNPTDCTKAPHDATITTKVFSVEQGRTRCYVRSAQ